MSDVTRRDFLRAGMAALAAAGGAWLLAGCPKKPQEAPPNPMPAPPTGAPSPGAPGYKTEPETKAAAPTEEVKHSETEPPQTAKDPAKLSDLEAKHVPQFDVPATLKKGQKATVTVNIGKVPHPMEATHWIMWAELYVDDKLVGKRVELKPGDKPQAKFEITPAGKATLKAHIYCNKHGLWENTKEITAA